MKIKKAILTTIPILVISVSIFTHKAAAQASVDTTLAKPFTITKINDKTYDKVDFNEIWLDTEDLSVSGTASAGASIYVNYDGKQEVITANQEGIWEFKKTLPATSYAINFSNDDAVYGVLFHIGQIGQIEGISEPTSNDTATSPGTIEINNSQPVSSVLKNVGILFGIAALAVGSLLVLKKIHKKEVTQVPQEQKVGNQL